VAGSAAAGPKPGRTSFSVKLGRAWSDAENPMLCPSDDWRQKVSSRFLLHAIAVAALLIPTNCKKEEVSTGETESMTVQPVENCATPQPTPAELTQFYQFASAVGAFSVTDDARLSTPVEVPVYVWVIRKGDVGAVSQQRVNAMIQLLNERYVGTRYRFRLVARTEITNHPEWYSMIGGSAAERAAKRALRKGGLKRLTSGRLMLAGSAAPAS
jgi:hypothetical protein